MKKFNKRMIAVKLASVGVSLSVTSTVTSVIKAALPAIEEQSKVTRVAYAIGTVVVSAMIADAAEEWVMKNFAWVAEIGEMQEENLTTE